MDITKEQIAAVLSWLLRNNRRLQDILDASDDPVAVPDPVITYTPIQGLYTMTDPDREPS
jgi:hypothetical protein